MIRILIETRMKMLMRIIDENLQCCEKVGKRQKSDHRALLISGRTVIKYCINRQDRTGMKHAEEIMLDSLPKFCLLRA